jgi:CRISPR/Cas system-associated exonuclease Cas4 (RecB family)
MLSSKTAENSKSELQELRRSPNTREVSTQIQLYTTGLKTMGRPVSSGSVAYLDEADVKPVDVSDPSLTVAKQNAQNVVENITKRKFKPTPGKSCERCDQNQICRWRAMPRE